MNRIIITVATIILLASCSKKNKKQYSYWKVNGVEYSSNNVIKSEGITRPISSLRSKDGIRFGISFNLEELPHSGNFTLNSMIHSPSFVGIGFYFDTIAYGSTEDNAVMLHASEQNGKLQFTLPQTWFVNINNNFDSVLVEGVFNEP